MSRDPRLPADDEPAYEAAAVLALADLRSRVEDSQENEGRCAVVAVDGRSASGKTTLATRLASAPGWALVHTDDIAWHHDFFDWADLLIDGVLAPLRLGEPVRYRPPAWDERGREGAVTVPPDSRVVVVEGVGASRAAFADHLDLAIWVHTPFEEVLRREDERIAAGESDAEFSRDWLTAEARFLGDDRPWSRADLVVAGSGGLDAGAQADVRTDPAQEYVRVLVDPREVAGHLGGSA